MNLPFVVVVSILGLALLFPSSKLLSPMPVLAPFQLQLATTSSLDLFNMHHYLNMLMQVLLDVFHIADFNGSCTCMVDTWTNACILNKGSFVYLYPCCHDAISVIAHLNYAWNGQMTPSKTFSISGKVRHELTFKLSLILVNSSMPSPVANPISIQLSKILDRICWQY